MVNLHVFILHCKSLETRKGLCDALFGKLKESGKFENMSFHYIEKYDIDEIGKKEVDEFVNLDKSKVLTPFESLLQGIHIRKLSNALKHFEALKQVASLPKEDIGLIIEDDVVYSENVAERLEMTLMKLKEYDLWDINFLGLPQPVSENPNIVKVNMVESIFKILPDISSYVVRPTSAKSLCECFLPIRFQTNIHFSYIMMEKAKGQFKFTMTTPNVFVDGSKFGVYLSSIKSNNKLILNQEYTKLYKIIHEKENFSDEEIQRIYKSFETTKFNAHPEFQTLLGVFEMKQKNYKKAKEIFDKCYEVYMNNDCLLNGESEFLEIYAKIFKYLQSDI